MIIHILMSVVFFFILMYLSINLLGLFVRGLFPQQELNRVKKESPWFITGSDKEYISKQKLTTIIALILNIAFFYLLFRIWNIGVVIAAIIIMAGRLPDLLWDIRHGKKTDPKLMEKNALYYISALLPWLALPVLYYSLYHF
jgi:hypothetical protein